MKWVFRILCVALAGAILLPVAFAQDSDHVEIGVFANFFRLQASRTNMLGAGARLSVNLNPYV